MQVASLYQTHTKNLWFKRAAYLFGLKANFMTPGLYVWAVEKERAKKPGGITTEFKNSNSKKRRLQERKLYTSIPTTSPLIGRPAYFHNHDEITLVLFS